VEKHVQEHLHQQRLGSVGVHSESEKVRFETKKKLQIKFFKFFCPQETLLKEYKLKSDYKDEEREICLFKDNIVDVIDISKADKWLVRTKHSNLIQVMTTSETFICYSCLVFISTKKRCAMCRQVFWSR
jgi:hypothetical protein